VKRSDFFTDAAVLATGSGGPIRVALDRLRRIGIGERVLKTVLAASASWALASLVPGSEAPILAPLTAIFTIQATLAESVSGAVQRLLGVLLGIISAAVISQVIGLNALSIGLVVLISLSVGIRLGLESPGAAQMAVTSILVLLGGTTNDFAAQYLADTLIGTAVGLALNSLLAPPTYLPHARLAFLALGEQVAGILSRLATSLDTGDIATEAPACLEIARAASSALEQARDALDRADESLQFHVLAARHQGTVNTYARANHALEHAAIQTRVIARTVSDISLANPPWIAPDRLGQPLAMLLSATATALTNFLTLVDAPGDQAAFLDSIAIAKERRLALATVTSQTPTDASPAEWSLLGGVLTIAGQLVSDLESAAGELSG
jgi:uncharacterized membrane protein YgaE (UPF0421/DUF939 family)